MSTHPSCYKFQPCAEHRLMIAVHTQRHAKTDNERRSAISGIADHRFLYKLSM